jgi:hypothetical protein
VDPPDPLEIPELFGEQAPPMSANDAIAAFRH